MDLVVWIRMTLVASLACLFVGCSNESPDGLPLDGRWYTQVQVDRGRGLYDTHCMSCHGERAVGTTEWRTPDADGNYPPPPLNGTAHTWHHSLDVLESSIAEGGMPNGGVMPGFAKVLNADDARATIAYFQSIWTDDIYTRWQEINAR